MQCGCDVAATWFSNVAMTRISPGYPYCANPFWSRVLSGKTAISNQTAIFNSISHKPGVASYRETLDFKSRFQARKPMEAAGAGSRNGILSLPLRGQPSSIYRHRSNHFERVAISLPFDRTPIFYFPSCSCHIVPLLLEPRRLPLSW